MERRLLIDRPSQRGRNLSAFSTCAAKPARTEGAEGVMEAREKSAWLDPILSFSLRGGTIFGYEVLCFAVCVEKSQKIGPNVGDAGYAGRCTWHYRHRGHRLTD